MIKVKLNQSQLSALASYLTYCITTEIKHIDKVKEFLLADAINNFLQRLLKKENTMFYFVANSQKKHTIKINNNEAVALSIYFKRYQTSAFLLPVEQQILSQFNKTELINIVK